MPESNDKHGELAELVGKAVAYTANEPILLLRLEKFFSPKPANLVNSPEEAESLRRRLGRLSEKLGGPPEIVMVGSGRERPRYDTYAGAAIDEILSAFHRSRRSVWRTHVCLIGSGTCKKYPDVLLPRMDADALQGVQEAMSEVFWEHAETSYIRLTSLWDRIGQLLDFVFFNIRQYERDGFPAVMDRVRCNYLPLSSAIASSEHWSRLRGYQTSETVDGLKWLVRRRNLLVHSLHLRPMELTAEEDPIFTSAYNHLDESIQRKLVPDTAENELEFLHSQLNAAARLFPDVLGLCELGLRTKPLNNYE